MSKNLEIEYQNMIRSEVPDIWDKIEAKIDAQEAKNVQKAGMADIAGAFATVSTEQNMQDKVNVAAGRSNVVSFKKKSSRWKYFVFPAAAAILCIAIAIPVMTNVGKTTAEAPSFAPSSAGSTGAGAAMDNYYENSIVTAGDCVAEAEEAYDYDYDPNYKNAEWNNNRGEDSNMAAAMGQSLTGNNGMSYAVQDMTQYSDDAESEALEVEGEEDPEYFYGAFMITLSREVPLSQLEEFAKELSLEIEKDESGSDEADDTYTLVTPDTISRSRYDEIIRSFQDSGFVKYVKTEERIR